MDKTMAAALAVIIVSIVAMLVLTPASAGTGNVQRLSAVGLTPPISVAVAAETASPGSASAAGGNGGIQTFTLGVKGNQYSPAEIRVKQGTKVRIEGDPNTLTGCMSTVNIDGYGISKRIVAGDNVIEFTADTSGTFPIHCNMGMGNGKLVVEDSSGTVPVQSHPLAVTQGTDGCGCGS